MEEKNHQVEEQTAAPEAQEMQKLKQQYAYLQADFDNYRKRMEIQRTQWSQNAQTEVLLPLLDIIDDFDRAQGDINNPAFDLIFKAFKKLINRFNITEITDTTAFDPHLHEAIMQQPTPEGATSGTIAQILQKGYKVGNTVLRPAKVAVYQ